MGKPSKNQRVASDRPQKKELPGKPILYVGTYGTSAECPSCGTKVTKAIMWEDSSKMYCSRGCIPKTANV